MLQVCFITWPRNSMIVLVTNRSDVFRDKQLADEYTSAFEKLMDVYEKIQKAMPMFSQLHKTFGNDEQFQVVLSWVYKDILEFHQAAHRFFRRRSWVIFFDTLWKGFQFRFTGILKKLA
jgi:hypothetical protein